MKAWPDFLQPCLDIFNLHPGYIHLDEGVLSGFLSFGFGWFRSLGPRELVSPSHSSKNILGIGRPFGLPKSGPETPPRLSHQAT